MGRSTHAKLTKKKLPLSKLQPHPKNPRIHPEPGTPEWAALQKSLESDYFDPIVWNKRNGMLVSGHLRTKVLAHLKYTHADCVVVDYDEETHLQRLLAANKLTGYDDVQALKDILTEAQQSGTTELTGYTDDEVAELLKDAVEVQDGYAATKGQTVELADTMFQMGEYRFKVERDRYLRWQEHLRQTVGFERASVEAHLQKLLGIV